MKKTTASLFTGGGGFEIGAIMAGFTPIWGVEIRPDIAAVAEANIPGLRVIVSDVAAVDYSSLERPDHLHASPKCTEASPANTNGEEGEDDLKSARATCRTIETLLPDTFTLENVWAYRNFDSFKLIVATLTRLGYFVDWWHLNSANYGVPQTRKRLILIARLDRQPTRPMSTHSKTLDIFGIYKLWVGWFEAIEDLIDTLPDSEFAPWQLTRLPAKLKTLLFAQGSYGGEVVNRDEADPAFTVTANSNQGGVRAVLVGGGNTNKIDSLARSSDGPAFTVLTGNPTNCQAYLAPINGESSAGFEGSEPAQTVAANHGAGKYRAFIIDQTNHRGENGKSTIKSQRDPIWTIPVYSQKHPSPRAFTGRVVKMTPRALARFQSFPDSYILPEPANVELWLGLKPSNGLACEIIGNAVPPLLAKAVCNSLNSG